MAIVWILKVRQKDEYVFSQTFSTQEEALAYIYRNDKHYYIPVRAEIKLKLRDD